jgi:hypothetical protein
MIRLYYSFLPLLTPMQGIVILAFLHQRRTLNHQQQKYFAPTTANQKQGFPSVIHPPFLFFPFYFSFMHTCAEQTPS